MSYRAGENGQLLALAEALGWPFESKRLAYRKYELAIPLLRGTGLAGILKGRSSPLVPPWPDLVISAGLRNEPVARWIRRRTGGTARLVFIGRTWAAAESFDLIITTPQYRLAEHPHVLHNRLTLHRVTETRLAEAAALWAPRLAHLPRPLLAVLIGGNSGPYLFDQRAAERLGRQASQMARAAGGSLLVTTSARTPRPASEALAAAIDCPVHLFRWTADASANPYLGYLALADALIVTGDSVAMLSEACATRKPVYIFDPNHAAGPEALSERRSGRRPGWRSWSGARAFCYRQAMRFGPYRLTRDVGLIHRWLIASGRAVWLGQPFPPGPPPPPSEDMQRAVARVRALFGYPDEAVSTIEPALDRSEG